MITDKIEEVKNTLEEVLLKEDIYTNIGKTERILSIASGTYIFLKGIRNVFSSPLIATTELVLGFGLLQRGISGYCSITEKLECEPQGKAPILVVSETV
ncbi:YgaP family membrane protein [Pedobacter alpinus]|uniref:DUF2892 domain-containing protein n=1 Tax=Pedobacter alpinus TaxID=1590643 RepID=A0ABW5TUS9_9SPHI